MQKKVLFILSSIIFLIFFINYSQIAAVLSGKFMGIEVIESEIAVGCEVEEQNEINVLDITFNGSPVVLEKNTNTIYVPQSLYKENWEGTLKTENGILKIEKDEYLNDKIEAIKTGHVFQLYLIKEDKYWRYNVVFTGMPLMCLETEKEENEIFMGNVSVFDPYRTGEFYQNAKCSFNVRGGSSKGFPKKGYKVRLSDEKRAFLGMRKDDDWILNALYDDAGLIHNKISMEVWEQITAYNTVNGDNGYHQEYLEVFIDGQYQGVYILSERVDEKELSLNEKDVLYKCRAVRIPEEHNYTNEDTDDLRPIFILKYPKVYEANDWNPLKQWVNCFLKCQVESYEEAEKLLNMENAIDYNLFCMLIAGSDNMRKNVFFTAEYQKDGNYQFVKNPWDLNATWGNPWVGKDESNNTLYDPEYYKNVRTWATDISTLYYLDEIKVSHLLNQRWKELRANKIIDKDNIYAMLDSEFAYLHESGAYARNYEKWPKGVEYWDDSYIYEYTEKRIDFLDQYFEELYQGNLQGAVYQGTDYSEEFEVRYYWEANFEALSEIYSYDVETLLEHYVWYGKPYGMKGRMESVSEIPIE